MNVEWDEIMDRCLTHEHMKNICKKQKYVCCIKSVGITKNIVPTFQIIEVYQSKSVTQYIYFLGSFFPTIM